MYLRKPFYKFFQFHLEHWPLTPSVKWIIEAWLTYIQPWKFLTVNNQIKTFNFTSEFIKDNLLIYTDIYQLILKRYCIIDLTNEDNLIILHRILSIFYSQAQIINNCKFSNEKIFDLTSKFGLYSGVHRNGFLTFSCKLT